VIRAQFSPSAFLMADLVKYNMRPEDLSKEIVFTLNTVAQISAKSIQTLHRTILILKLFDEIQMAIVPPLSGLNRTEGAGI
jgi:hypothetical protein